jgi:4-hydroxy-tetrahydrodipicolinate synthase
VLGTTGETPTMSKQEKNTLVEYTVSQVKKRVGIVVGIGGNNTSDVVLSIHSTPLKGVDGILSVCPYYNKPQQDGIYRHFKAIAEASPVPVILYTVPARTSSNISAATTLRLARDFKNIAGIKEASGNFDQIFQVLKNRPADFLVLSGDDALTLPMLAAGADGVISVAANACPKEFSDMVRAGLAGDFTRAKELHFLLLDFMHTLFLDGSPSGIKAALELLNLCENELRLPLVPINADTRSRIAEQLTRLKNFTPQKKTTQKRTS